MEEILPRLLLKDYQEDRKERGIYDKRNPLNDLTGKEWLFSTKTIIPKDFPPVDLSQLRSRNFHPIPFDLSKEIIETFSKPGELILDPLAGIGSTLIGTHLSNLGFQNTPRKCIGLENEEGLITSFNHLSTTLNLSNQEMLYGNPLDHLNHIKKNSIDFLLCDIPVWNVTGKKDVENYAMSYNLFYQTPKKVIEKWFSSLQVIFSESIQKLKNLKYLVIAIPSEDIQESDEFESYSSSNFALSSILAHSFQSIGLVLKAERIWFKPKHNTKDIQFLNSNRRFLVFRKETNTRLEQGDHSIFFKEKIPFGNTYVIHKSFPPSFSHKLRKQHGGMKPPELAELLIQKYSQNTKDIILDPFAGVGGTLLGASLTKRRAIGIDINEHWKEIYFQVSNENGLTPQKFFVNDSRVIIDKEIKDESIDLVLTDVPYWAMDKLKKTRGRFSKAGEESRGKLPSSLKQFNQSSVLTINEWLNLLEDVFSICYRKLIPKKHLIVFIGNMYRTMPEMINGRKEKIGRYLMLSSKVAKVLLNIGFNFESEILWYSPDKALHVFGYPFSYIPSVVHQSILVFKK